MSALIFSAHDLATTRLCQAHRCPDDAQPGWALCDRHERARQRGEAVPLHEIQQPTRHDPAIQLWCFNCETWKPDDDFSRRATATTRRRRGPECKTCAATRRRRRRLDPAVKAREAAIQKARRAKREKDAS